MNTLFKNYFNQQILVVENSINNILNEAIIKEISDITGLDKSKDIAECIVKTELFFTMISELEKDLNKNARRKENDTKIIKLVNKIEDIPSLFYNNRMSYWYHLSDKGRIIDTRLRYWYYDWGYKNSVCHKLSTYLKVLDKILKAQEKRAVHFVPMLDCLDYRQFYNVKSIDTLLKMDFLGPNGFEINLLEELDYLINGEKVAKNIQYSSERYASYRDMLTLKMRQSSPFVENEIKNIEKLIKDLTKTTKTGELNKTNLSKYEFIIKAPSQEYIIDDTTLYSVFIKKYQQILDRLPKIKDVEVRKKRKIDLTLSELLESAKELDVSIGKNDGKKCNRFTSTLSDTEFIDIKSQLSSHVLSFDGLNNFVGIVNTGKTTFMLIVAHALAKKGLKTGLVLRDNEDVFTQVRELNKDKNIKAVPLVGSSDKKNHQLKILDYNLTDIQSNQDEVDLSFMNDYMYKYGEYICPLKTFIKTDTSAQKNDIFNSAEDGGKLLCNHIYYKNKKNINPINISCPFVYDCDTLKVYEEIDNADIYITNTQSFIQTKMNRYFVKNEPRVSKYIYDTCDLVLKDESDAVLFTMDSSFTNATSLLGDLNKPSILENISQYRDFLTGNTVRLKKERRIVTRIEETRTLAEEILQLLSENRIPSFITRGPITSGKVFNALSWILLNDVTVIKDIESMSKTGNHLENIKDLIDENFNINEVNQKILLEEFKELSRFIYEDSKVGYISGKKINENSELVEKYSCFTSLLSSIYKYDDLLTIKSKCYEYIVNNLNLGNPDTTKFINDNENARLIITDIIVFAVALVKLESDFIEMMGASSSVKSTLRSLSKKNVEDIPAVRGYVKDYRGILPQCPLELFFGLSYDKQTETLRMISWDNVGRHMINEFDCLWRYLEGDLDSGINVGLFSGTSYMPTSPLYHIEIPPKYLMRPKTEKNLNVKQMFLPEKYSNGKFIYNSGENKSDDKKADSIYKGIAEALCVNYKNEKTKLTYYLNNYTEPNRKRILISVGNYRDAVRLANHLYKFANEKGDTALKIAYLKSDKSNLNYSEFDIPDNHGLKRSDIKNIKNTNFNIVVVPQTALQRGINMVQFTSQNKNGVSEASFSCIIKTNRDYQVPNAHEYAVSRVNHVLVKELFKMKDNTLSSDYNLTSEVNNLLTKLKSVYSDYYKTKYFTQLLDEERAMLIGDLCVEDFQFIGRVIRGYSDATVINIDSAFFRNYTSKGIKDTEKTSTIVAVSWMMDYIKKDIIKTYNEGDDTELNSLTKSKLKEFDFIMKELYGPFLDGIDKLINELF